MWREENATKPKPTLRRPQVRRNVAASQSKTNHRVTENTEKNKTEKNNLLQWIQRIFFVSYLFRAFFSVFSVTLWLGSDHDGLLAPAAVLAWSWRASCDFLRAARFG